MQNAYLLILSMLPLCAQDLPDAKALLTGESDALKNFVSYQYSEESTTQMTVMGNPVNVVVTTQVQAVSPNKLRMEMKTGNQISSIMISDGENTWVYIPMLKQYSKVPASDADLKELGSTIAADAAQVSADAKTVRSESIDVDGMPHDCWVVESHVENQAMGGMEIQNAVYTAWIDKELGIALKRTMTGKMKGGPVPAGMEMRNTSVKHSLKFNEALPYSLFTFVPPADARETDFADGFSAGIGGTAGAGALGGGVGTGGRAPARRGNAAPKPPQTLPQVPAQPKPTQAGEPQAFVPFLTPLHREKAEWPESAKAQGIEGMVEVLVTVDPQGSVANVEALTGPEVLRKPAADAVRQWKFRPVLRGGRAVFAYTEASVDFLDFSKPVTPDSFGHDIREEIAAGERIQELQKRWPRSPAQVLADLEQDSEGRDDVTRGYELPQLAKAALAAGALDKASLYANELLASAHQGDWNEGNAIHDGNMVRGLVALRSGNVEQAAKDLIEAGKSTGSPQLNSFGPNLTLASELLEKGQRDAVLEYLTLCKKFWTLGANQLDTWIDTIRSGGKPEFGANLVF